MPVGVGEEKTIAPGAIHEGGVQVKVKPFTVAATAALISMPTLLAVPAVLLFQLVVVWRLLKSVATEPPSPTCIAEVPVLVPEPNNICPYLISTTLVVSYNRI